VKKVSSNRVYAQEATEASATDVLSVALSSLNDYDGSDGDVASFRSILMASLKACEEAQVRGAVLRRVFTFSVPVPKENNSEEACRGPVSVFVNEIELSVGVGAKLWKAAHMLSMELASAPCLCSGKDVLEIGSGVGLCGLLAGKLNASRVVLSDFEPRILLSLRDAVIDNKLNGKARVVMLDWRRERKLFAAEKCPRSNLSTLSHEEKICSVHKCEQSGVHCSTQRDCGLLLASNKHGVRVKHCHYEKREHREEGNAGARALRGETSLHETEKGAQVDALDDHDRFDLIIGADVLYENYHVDILPKVFARRLKTNGIGKLCGAVRYRKLLDALIQNLNDEGFDVTETDIGAKIGDCWYDGGYISLTIMPTTYAPAVSSTATATNSAREHASFRVADNADQTAYHWS
jgi:predicted nicotinamide N-methyase